MKESTKGSRAALLICASASLYAGTVHAALAEQSGATQRFVASRYGMETLAWEKGQFLNLCSAATGNCQSVKMPKTLGKIERVIEGPFIASARASWIAQSKFDTFVCAALKGRTTVACAKVDGGVGTLDSDGIGVTITAEYKTRIVMVSDRKTVDKAELGKASAAFAQSIWHTAHVLQGEVDQAAMGMSSFASSMMICDKDPRWPGPPPHPDCELIEDGNSYMWSCSIPGTPWPSDPPPLPTPELPPCL